MQIKLTIVVTSLAFGIGNAATAHELVEPGQYRWNESRASGYRDTDQDGVSDFRDVCFRTPAGTQVGPNGCPVEHEDILTSTSGEMDASDCADSHFHYGGTRSPSATISPGSNAVRRQKEYDLVLQGCIDNQAAGNVVQNRKLSTMGLRGRTDD